MSTKGLLLCLVLIIAAGSVLRITAIDTRPIHHDEVSAQMIGASLLQYGGYKYDPEFHGPVTFYIVALGIKVFGNTEIGLRIIHVLLSIATLAIIPWLLRTWPQRITAATLLVLSPTILYYSNYAYFESAWILAYSIWIIAALATLAPQKDTAETVHAERGARWIYLFAAMSAVMLATHEFTYAIFAGLVGYLMLEHAIMTYVRRGASAGTRTGTRERSRAKTLPPAQSALQYIGTHYHTHKAHYIKALALGIFLLLALWSVGFTNIESIPTSLQKSITYNIHKSTTPSGHDKPIYYYLQLLLVLEALPILFFRLSFTQWRHGETRFLQFLFLFSFTILSITRYKTPWGMTLIIPPLVILAAITIDRTYNLIQESPLLQFLVVAAIALGIIQLVAKNYAYPTNELHNPLAYQQTEKDLWTFERKITELKPKSILIIGSERQIVGWVLKDYNVKYENKRDPMINDVSSYDAVIADSQSPRLDRPAFPFTIRPGVQQILYTRTTAR